MVWQADVQAWYSETLRTIELVNRRGWGVWANDAPLSALGVHAIIMNHLPDQRRASVEKMVRAVGFDPVHFTATTVAR